MIQGRFVKGNEVTEIITDGKPCIEVPEKGPEAFTFQRREKHPRIETMAWPEIYRLAAATGGTLAAMIIAVMSLPDMPFAQVFFVAVGVLDAWLILKHLRKPE